VGNLVRQGLAVAGVLVVAAIALAAWEREDERATSSETGATEGRSEVSGEPGPWSIAADVARSRRGEVHEKIMLVAAGQTMVLKEEWITFDLDAARIDRAIVLPERTTGVKASRERPSLQFRYTADDIYMRRHGIEEQCGASWAVMPPGLAAGGAAGVDIDPANPLLVEPLAVLGSLDEPGPPVELDKSLRGYKVTVSGGTGLPLSSAVSKRPGVADRLAALEHPAWVWLDPDGGRAEVVIDLSAALDVIGDDLGTGETAGAKLMVAWTISERSRVDIDLPEDAASQAECD